MVMSAYDMLYAKKYIVGMISKCQDNNMTNPMGKIVSDRINQLVNLFQTHVYYEVDVCRSQSQLVNETADLFLNERWYGESKNRFGLNESQHTIEYVITYMPDEMQHQLMKLIPTFGFKISILPLTKPDEQNLVSWNWRTKEYYIGKGIKAYLIDETIETIVSQNKLKYFSIIEIGGTNETKDDTIKVMEYLKEKLKSDKSNNQVCFNHTFITNDTIGSSSMKNTIERLASDENLQNIFVFGSPTHIRSFIKDTIKQNLNNKYWILLSTRISMSEVTGLESYIVIPNVRREADNWLSYNETLVIYDTYLNKSICNTTKIKSDVEAYCRLIPRRLLTDLLGKMRSTIRKNITQVFNGQSTTLKSLNEIHLNETKSSECLKYSSKNETCLETKFGKIEQQYSNQSWFVGELCYKCHKKYHLENGFCKNCTVDYKPTQNQSACYHAIRNNISIENCIINFIGLTLTLAAVYISVRFKNTPVVRSSDYTLSVVQQIFFMLWFISAPVLYLLRPSKNVCSLRPYILETLVLAVISIMVCKAEKILIVYYAKLRLTRKDVKDIKVRQIAMFGFLIIVGVIIISALQSKSTFETPDEHKFSIDDQGNALYFLQCPKNKLWFHRSIYCMVVLSLALLQGYRGRSLPTNYNDGKSIFIGASLAICLILLMISLMSYENHTVIKWGFECAMMISLLISLYGHKSYIIIFKPEQNTRQYLLTQILADARRRNQYGKRKSRTLMAA